MDPSGASGAEADSVSHRWIGKLLKDGDPPFETIQHTLKDRDRVILALR